MKTLSVIVPVYNEMNTVSEILNQISDVRINLKMEVIIINDGSTDESLHQINLFLSKERRFTDINYKLINKINEGKGSAVKKGISESSGEIILIQDADLEYNPLDYQKLLDPIINGHKTVIYGSRLLGCSNNRHSNMLFYFGGIIVTKLTNFLYGSKLTDAPTCYKVFKSEVLKLCNHESKGFEWEPEVTAKLLRMGVDIGEVEISYNPRKVNEGKKINWLDGLKAIITLIKWRIKPVNAYFV